MGVEVSPEYGGTGSSFFGSCLTIEEVARVDPAVAVLVDVQNTLVETIFMQYGNKEQNQKYLPLLATKSVSSTGRLFLNLQINFGNNCWLISVIYLVHIR